MDNESTPLIETNEQFNEERKPRALKDLIFIVNSTKTAMLAVFETSNRFGPSLLVNFLPPSTQPSSSQRMLPLVPT
jgi:hypothetical protein